MSNNPNIIVLICPSLSPTGWAVGEWCGYNYLGILSECCTEVLYSDDETKKGNYRCAQCSTSRPGPKAELSVKTPWRMINKAADIPEWISLWTGIPVEEIEVSINDI